MSKAQGTIKRVFRLINKDLSANHSSYIFFITSECNQACEVCFYADNINKSADLTLEEIKSAFSRMGPISNMLLSGGEPILRRELLEIVEFLVKNNQIKSLTIPSNGMSGNLLCTTVARITDTYPQLFLQVCISLDGTEEVHDRLRGVKGAHKKAVETIKALEKMAREYDRLSLNINTVISPKNVLFIKEIIHDVEQLEIKHYSHSFEIVRPHNIGKRILFDNINELKKAYNGILRYKDRLFLRGLKCNPIMKLILGAMHYANIYSLYKIQFEYSAFGKNWPMPCCAGKDNNVIYNNGDMSICELRKPFSNIKLIGPSEE